MNLWIRSQDRMNLVQIKQISINYYNNKQIIANYKPDQYENSGCYYELLGTYETNERALEVLDEIQAYINSDVMFNLNVFEMPKELEEHSRNILKVGNYIKQLQRKLIEKILKKY